MPDNLAKSPPENLTPKEWVTAARVGFQQQVVTFLLWAYGLSLTASFAMFFLQGFRLHGFDLGEHALLWLGSVTVGELAGLLTLTIRAVFR